MLSGLKFIPRDHVDRENRNSDDDVKKESKKLARKNEKDRSRKKSSRYGSSDDESVDRIKQGSRKKKKWYASDEDLSSQSGSESEDSSDYDKRKSKRKKKKQKKRHKDGSEDEHRVRLDMNSRGRRKEMSFNVSDSSESDDSSREGRFHKREKKANKATENSSLDSEIAKSSGSLARKEMGLDWMLRPKDTPKEDPIVAVENKIDDASTSEVDKVNNPRELNPYYNDNGSGYPHESEDARASGNQLLSSSLVGDGGASWRLKALKRAKEQAAREGRKIDEVVEDRWGSLSHLAVSVATRAAAPTRAHLHAIQNRRKGVGEEERSQPTVSENYDGKGGSLHHARMKVPKVQDSLSWGKRRVKMSSEDTDVVSAAISGINKFKDDGSFLGQFVQQTNDVFDHRADNASVCSENRVELSSTSKEHKVADKDVSVGKLALTANQLAAKVMQLRMKGKHEEAEKLMRETETLEVKQGAEEEPQGPQKGRYVMQDTSLRKKRREEDADLHLAKSIMRNHQYSMSGRADDEYDYEEGPRKKSWKKGRDDDNKSTEVTNFSQRMLTQKKRCQFCFENPNRPKHLVVAIANFAYLSLPLWEPIVQGHCCILTMQHESATRSVDDNVWNEIRNFKKCLLMMLAKQEKDAVFLETVIGITRQRRHCMVECIPLPRNIAKQAPVYFKKAIDEAEDEWSQHNAKKLIDTSQKGLRGSIPKNFPYFYVEFGLDKGFVHVIDNETDFESSFGLNVIRGMLQLPPEDMHRRRKHESVDKQKQAVAAFAKDWEPFDWTKQL